MTGLLVLLFFLCVLVVSQWANYKKLIHPRTPKVTEAGFVNRADLFQFVDCRGLFNQVPVLESSPVDQSLATISDVLPLVSHKKMARNEGGFSGIAPLATGWNHASMRPSMSFEGVGRRHREFIGLAAIDMLVKIDYFSRGLSVVGEFYRKANGLWGFSGYVRSKSASFNVNEHPRAFGIDNSLSVSEGYYCNFRRGIRLCFGSFSRKRKLGHLTGSMVYQLLGLYSGTLHLRDLVVHRVDLSFSGFGISAGGLRTTSGSFSSNQANSHLLIISFPLPEDGYQDSGIDKNPNASNPQVDRKERRIFGWRYYLDLVNPVVRWLLFAILFCGGMYCAWRINLPWIGWGQIALLFLLGSILCTAACAIVYGWIFRRLGV